MRKAFLDLDLDYDGYIRPEDIARYFSNESSRINYNELKQLMVHKGKQKGYLDFTDFSKWMGSAIQPSGGFFFRHDSIRNPQYEENLDKVINHNEKHTRIVRDKMTEDDFLKTFVEKVQFQWKTLKKAFTDLNSARSGMILPKELHNFMKHWGFDLNEKQFKILFDKLDYDKDGKISYADFQNSVGNEISPPEFLYFKQEFVPQVFNKCYYKK